MRTSHRRQVRFNLKIEIPQSVQNLALIETPQHVLASSLAHLKGKRLIVDESFYRRTQCGWVANLYEHSRLSVLNHLAASSDVCGYHREFHGGCLQANAGDALTMRGQSENIHRREIIGHIFLEAGKAKNPAFDQMSHFARVNRSAVLTFLGADHKKTQVLVFLDQLLGGSEELR